MNDLTPNPPPSVCPFSEEPAVTVPVFRPPVSPEDQTMFFPNAEGAPPLEPPTRIPHLGHAVLFLAIAGLFLLLIQLLTLGFAHPAAAATSKYGFSAKFLVGSEALSYLATLALSWFIFPILWKRPFAEGIQANLDAARRNALRLIPIGIVLSISVQAISSLATMPKDIPMDDFFRTLSDVWLVTAFGTLVAPLFEEVLFRGFLIPAFAIAYDWLSLPRTPAAREAWHATNKLTPPALVFSAVLSSILFTALHGQQTGFAWPVLILLFCVSLVLSYVRIRLRSVMASTLIHVSYNATIFLFAFVATGGYRHLDKITH